MARPWRMCGPLHIFRALEFPKCHALRFFLFLRLIKPWSRSSSLHLFLLTPQRPLRLLLFLSLPPPSRLACSPLDCCVSHFPFFAPGGHDVVVAARPAGLLTSGGRRHLLPHHRAALQGVQREESEASGAAGDGQQTKRRQAEER